jgi:hypothetical protein
MELKFAFLIISLISIGSLSSAYEKCAQVNWVGCARSIASRVYDMHKWSDGTTINLVGIPCIGRIKGRFGRNFKWNWDGFFECVGFAVGEGRGFSSRPDAIYHAIQNFIEKNVSRFTPQQKNNLLHLY